MRRLWPLLANSPKAAGILFLIPLLLLFAGSVRSPWKHEEWFVWGFWIWGAFGIGFVLLGVARAYSQMKDRGPSK
jgi:hypothetical protein